MRKILFSLIFLLSGTQVLAAKNEADTLIEKAEQQIIGDSFQGKITMIVDKQGSKRSLGFRTWSVGRDKALVKILAPAKDRGTGNLRLQFNLWQYLPNVERVIKIPPSMMLQSWMGSDFTNDDLVKSSSLSRDYKHSIEKKEKLGDTDTVKVICEPKPDAPVVWGKVNVWVRAKDAVPVQQEFYSENGQLLRKMVGTDLKTFGSHTIPTTLTMETVKSGSKTTMKYEDVVFDKKIDAEVFSQANLRRAAKD